MFWSDDCRSWPREEKINNHGCWGKYAHVPDNDYWGICLFHVLCTNIFFAIILMWYTRNIYIYIFFFINWTLRMSDNLPERVKSLCHAHIIYITVLENRIIWCPIFCDLLLKSAFERIFNVMQYPTRISFPLLYWKTELSAVQYFAICSWNLLLSGFLMLCSWF
jgi:cellobiose-specific phosphotransferase system component IIC